MFNNVCFVNPKQHKHFLKAQFETWKITGKTDNYNIDKGSYVIKERF